MTGLIAIDESGDLGANGSRFFLMAAIITNRTKYLSKAYKTIPTTDDKELKFYLFHEDERRKILSEIAIADVNIVYVCVDKQDSNEPYRSGNDLYYHALRELMRCAMENFKFRDINIFVDENGFIKTNELKELSTHLSNDLNKNVKKCEKASFNKCVKIADCVAGSLWANYERENKDYYNMIKAKVSIARESLRPR